MNNFLISIAPFIVLIGSIVFAFWAAAKDSSVSKEE